MRKPPARGAKALRAGKSWVAIRGVMWLGLEARIRANFEVTAVDVENCAELGNLGIAITHALMPAQLVGRVDLLNTMHTNDGNRRGGFLEPEKVEEHVPPAMKSDKNEKHLSGHSAVPICARRLGERLDHVDSFQPILLNSVCFSIARAGIERDILRHSLVRVEPNRAEP